MAECDGDGVRRVVRPRDLFHLQNAPRHFHDLMLVRAAIADDGDLFALELRYVPDPLIFTTTANASGDLLFAPIIVIFAPLAMPTMAAAAPRPSVISSSPAAIACTCFGPDGRSMYLMM